MDRRLGIRSLASMIALAIATAHVDARAAAPPPPPAPAPAPAVYAPLTTSADADDPPPTEKRPAGLRPRWMWVGFGTSLGLTTVFAGATIGTTLRLQVGLRKELLAAVDASTLDDRPENDISRGEADICAAARSSPMNDGNVTNASVTRICNQADAMNVARNTMLVFTVVGLASTIAFSVLLGVNPKPKRRAIAIAPQLHPRGGSLAVSGRF